MSSGDSEVISSAVEYATGLVHINGYAFNLLVEQSGPEESAEILADLMSMMRIGSSSCHFYLDVANMVFIRHDDESLAEARIVKWGRTKYWRVRALVQPEEITIYLRNCFERNER